MEIFAAVDLETSGLNMDRCEILEMAIVPLNEDFSISKDIPEFTARIKAEHPENAEAQAMRINRLDLTKGESRTSARDNFLIWMRDNGIERICPVAHNLEFDMGFLKKTFPELRNVFSSHGRDSMRLALTINDIYCRENGENIFPKASLQGIKRVIGLDGDVLHNALEDAKDAAHVYRKLTQMLSMD